MPKSFRANVAYVSGPNTLETDRQRTVLHDVRVCIPAQDGDPERTGIVKVMAEEPSAAMERVRKMPFELVERLLDQ